MALGGGIPKGRIVEASTHPADSFKSGSAHRFLHENEQSL